MNGTMLQGFSWYLEADGKHWDRIAHEAKRYADAGITAVWLPPAYKGQGGKYDVGYGVYDTYDLGEFDQKGTVATKYGTKEEYLAAIDAIHAQGMQALADVVLDHRLGADTTEQVIAQEVDSRTREYAISAPGPITTWTKFSFPGRAGKYSDFIWDWNCFHGTDYDEASKRNSIFLFQGKHWSRGVGFADTTTSDYLMGCDVDEMYWPVYAELLRWGEWYIETCHLDGFRIDSAKHMDREFFLRWLPTLRREFKQELFAVGEYWSENVAELQAYLGHEGIMSLFDVPLYKRLNEASTTLGVADLSRIFDGSLVQADPVHAVTFVENRDSQPGQALQSFVQDWFKPAAYALILLREAGYPCVTYSDLFGMPGEDGPRVKELPLLMELRRRFSYGEQFDYLDNPDVIGWTREGDREHYGSGVAVILTNHDGGTKRMYVGKRHAGERWVSVCGLTGDTLIDAEGFGSFSCADGALSVYLPQKTADILECGATKVALGKTASGELDGTQSTKDVVG